MLRKLLFLLSLLLAGSGQVAGVEFRFEPGALRNAAVELSGKWIFAPGRFLPAEEETWSAEQTRLVEIPHILNSVEFKGQSLPGTGFASYRARVDTGQKIEFLSLKLQPVGTAYQLYIDGQLVKSVGIPSEEKESTIEDLETTTVTFQPRGRIIDVVIHLANFRHPRGGLWYAPSLATPAGMLRTITWQALFDFSLVGGSLLIGIYHLGLFFRRRKEFSHLFFSLFCFVIAFRILTMGEAYLSDTLQWQWLLTFDFASFQLAAPLFILFLSSLFQKHYNRNILWFLLGTWGSFLLVTIFSPPMVFGQFLLPGQVMLLLTAAFLFSGLARAWHSKDTGASLILLACLLLFITVLVDIMTALSFIYLPSLVHLGLFLFIAIQAVVLSGRFAQAITMAENLTDSLEERVKERTRSLRETNAAKTNFLATMSHEIRTPLNAIIGSIDVLQETKLNPVQQKYTDILGRSGKVLLQQINDILDFSKIEAGSLTIENIAFDLHEVLNNVKKIMSLRIQKKSLMLTLVIDHDVPHYIKGDPSRLEQVLLNLVSNSVKFTSQGYILISAEVAENQEEISLSVSDTGLGIPEKMQEKIFDRFTQVDGSISRIFGGSGLGLAISKHLVELMGGFIKVKSVSGIGSTFQFSIPLRRAEMNKASAESGITHDIDFSDKKILLAEDNQDNATLIIRFLQVTQAEVTLAANGFLALELFENGDFDLVLMDMQMPIIDGLTATKMIRQYEQRLEMEHTPIIALTANATAEDVRRSEEAGCDSHLSKPITKARLLEYLARVFKNETTTQG